MSPTNNKIPTTLGFHPALPVPCSTRIILEGVQRFPCRSCDAIASRPPSRRSHYSYCTLGQGVRHVSLFLLGAFGGSFQV